MGREGSGTVSCTYVKGRLSAGFSRETSPYEGTCKYSAPYEFGEKECAFGYSPRPSATKSNRNSTKHPKSRLLQPFLHSSKSDSGEVASHLGPQNLQHLHAKGEVQDGDSRIHQRKLEHRRLGHFPGLHFSIPSYSNSPIIKKIPPICNKQHSIPISSSANGTDFFSENFYQSHKMCTGAGASGRDTLAPVSRRLVGESSFAIVSKDSHRSSKEVSSGARFLNQLREVRADSDPGNHVLGIQILPAKRDCSSNSGEMGEDPECNTTLFEPSESHSPDVAVTDRFAGSYGEAGVPGNASSPTHSDSSNRSMVPNLSITRRFSSCVSDSVERAEVVAERTSDNARSSPDQEECTVLSIYRCVGDRLGRPPREHGSSGAMGAMREKVACQCSGDACCNLCAVPVQGLVKRKVSDVGYGQHNSDVLHQETGRHKVQRFVESDSDVVPFPKLLSDRPPVQAYSREIKCSSRQAFQEESSASQRMEFASPNLRKSLDSLGKTSSGLVRHEGQLQASPVCFPSSGYTSLGNRCSEHLVERSVCLCLSPNGNSDQSTEQDTEHRVRNHPGSPSLGEATMVLDASKPAHRRSIETSSLEKNVKAAQIGRLPSVSSGLQPSCLEVIRECKQNEGFSREVATRMAESQKSSTLLVYQGKWDKFREWCSDKGIDPFMVSVPLVADFLCYLHKEKSLALSTIEGYRTAISRMIRAKTGLDLGKNQDLSSLLANFARDKPVKKTLIPSWDLSLVLQALTNSPFEPMHLAPIKYVTLKTVFLLALASGRRRGEIHALMDNIQRSENWSEITIFTDPSFVAKTQIRCKTSAVKPLTIKSLTKELDTSLLEDRSLCVVRAIRYYLDRTKDVRENRKRLFIAYKKGHTHDICKNTISGWIKKAIILAYEGSSQEQRTVAGVKAHDVRGVASSLALMKNASIDSILEACSWRSHTTFTRFYLKDLTRIQEKLLVLGPVVAALQTV